MRYEMHYEQKLDEIILHALKRFPEKLKTDIISFLTKNNLFQVNEIRLHDGSYITFIVNSRNIKSDIFIEKNYLNELVPLICEGAVYAHFNTIKEGYISLGNGIRAGICGRATVEGDEICGISSFSSINIRLPKRIRNSGDYLFNLLKEHNFRCSVILYSRPGVGKTTILRELIYLLSMESIPLRHAVIDSREEITPFMDAHLMHSDVFISYPKGLAIEIATKTMTPEIIICDEISSKDEATAILHASNNGVVLIATTHARSFEELCSKEILKELFSHKIFDYALGIERDVGSCKYNFTLNKLNELL